MGIHRVEANGINVTQILPNTFASIDSIVSSGSRIAFSAQTPEFGQELVVYDTVTN